MEEDAASAAKRLSEVLDHLDFPPEQEGKIYTLFDTAVQSRLRHESFADLESYFENLRTHKTRFPGGGWKEYRFCDILATCYGSKEDPDKAWRDHFDRLERWRTRFPMSGIAAAVEAEAWVNYAWEARGSSYADTVSEEGWRLFSERLEKGQRILQASQAPRTPMWFYSMLLIAKGQSWEREEYDKIFNEAVRMEPLFFGFYTEKAAYLLPRWHGQEGEWQAFARESADRIGGDEGDALYYLITACIWDYFKDRSFFTGQGVSWPRMQRGFEADEKRHGLSWSRLNKMCIIAGQAIDRREARLLFDRIGNKWDMSVWRNRAQIDDFRDWLNIRGQYADD